jgi:hypothetical protein
MAKVQMICHCGNEYTAKEADLRRGWGYSCGKSCAAIRRDFGRPKAKRADGIKTKQIKKSPSSDRADNRPYGKYDNAVDWYNNTQVHPLSSEGIGQD